MNMCAIDTKKNEDLGSVEGPDVLKVRGQLRQDLAISAREVVAICHQDLQLNQLCQIPET